VFDEVYILFHFNSITATTALYFVKTQCE